MCILYNLYCVVHVDYTDSQLYFDIILHYIYRMCVKINVLYVQSATTSVQCPAPTVVILNFIHSISYHPIIAMLYNEVRKELRDALV